MPRSKRTTSNEHKGHTLSYVQIGTTSYTIKGIDGGGNIIVDWTSETLDDISESYLYCEDCGQHVNGEEINASNSWSAL